MAKASAFFENKTGLCTYEKPPKSPLFKRIFLFSKIQNPDADNRGFTVS